MAEKQTRPNPLEGGKGQSDEVDQSRGVFPFGTPHPPDAEVRTPGSFGGPYEESGRGGVELPAGPVAPRPPAAEQAPEPSVVEREESKEPAGQLPPFQREPK
jgi:hypothetical protein